MGVGNCSALLSTKDLAHPTVLSGPTRQVVIKPHCRCSLHLDVLMWQTLLFTRTSVRHTTSERQIKEKRRKQMRKKKKEKENTFELHLDQSGRSISCAVQTHCFIFNAK